MTEYFDILNSNGEYTNKIASREECHEKGLWHKAVVLIIISEDNKWDITAGGHVLAGEFGYQACIRETKEELNIEIDKNSIEFIGATTSENIKEDIINRHFNEYYVAHKNIELKEITLQKEEVQDIKWFDIEDLRNRINNNYEGLTGKYGCWNYLMKYIEIND